MRRCTCAKHCKLMDCRSDTTRIITNAHRLCINGADSLSKLVVLSVALWWLMVIAKWGLARCGKGIRLPTPSALRNAHIHSAGELQSRPDFTNHSTTSGFVAMSTFEPVIVRTPLLPYEHDFSWIWHTLPPRRCHVANSERGRTMAKQHQLTLRPGHRRQGAPSRSPGLHGR
jgi:hypothetical protein